MSEVNQVSAKKKIYGFNNGGSPGWYKAIAIGEDGAVVGSHICSSEAFMRHDLGINGSDWKHDSYDKHFGEGNWEIEWVPSDQVKSHPGLLKAIELNAVAGDSPVHDKAGVTVTMAEEC